jgi:uncharacterized protein with PIN domain
MSFDDLPKDERKRCPKCGRPAMEYMARKEEGQVVQMEHWICRNCSNRIAAQEMPK